jgi:hypothetical protein
LEGPLGATLVAVQTKLSQFAPRVARFMVMLRDEPTAEEKLSYHMEAVLTDLNLASYIDGAAKDVARLFPFNDECADLYARVSFAGQDRSLFVELIQRCVNEALRKIGARSLDQSNRADAQIISGDIGESSQAEFNPPSSKQPRSVERADETRSEMFHQRSPRRKRKGMTSRRKRGA